VRHSPADRLAPRQHEESRRWYVALGANRFRWAFRRDSETQSPLPATWRPGATLCFWAFDLVWLDGDLLIHVPYADRRAALEELDLAGPCAVLPPLPRARRRGPARRLRRPRRHRPRAPDLPLPPPAGAAATGASSRPPAGRRCTPSGENDGGDGNPPPRLPPHRRGEVLRGRQSRPSGARAGYFEWGRCLDRSLFATPPRAASGSRAGAALRRRTLDPAPDRAHSPTSSG
jgi:hypothetical protein